MNSALITEIARLAEAAGCDVDLATAASDRCEAGDVHRPRREIDELDHSAEVACVLLGHDLSNVVLLDGSAHASYE